MSHVDRPGHEFNQFCRCLAARGWPASLAAKLPPSSSSMEKKGGLPILQPHGSARYVSVAGEQLPPPRVEAGIVMALSVVRMNHPGFDTRRRQLLACNTHISCRSMRLENGKAALSSPWNCWRAAAWPPS